MLAIMVVLLDALEAAKTGVMVVAKVLVLEHVTLDVKRVVTTHVRNRAKDTVEAIALFHAKLCL